MFQKLMKGVAVALMLCAFHGSVMSEEPDGSLSESKLTYGMVKRNIKIGQSTQADVLKLFGSPDNMVMRKGREIWVYDRYRVETDSSTSSGYGTILLVGGSQSSTSTSTRVRTITVIFDFSNSGIVEDFSMRVGGY